MNTVQEKAEMAMRMVRSSNLVVVDSETSGLDWKRNFAVGYVFTVGNDSVYVPVRHKGGGNLYDPSQQCTYPDTAQVDDASKLPNHLFEVDLAKEIAKSPAKFVGHNLKFDCHFMAQRGIMLGRNLSCTMNNQTLVDEYTAGYSLDALAKRYKVTCKLGEAMYEHISRVLGVAPGKNSMAHYWELPGSDQMAVEYAEGDGVSTWQVYFAQQNELDRQGVGELVRRVEDELIWTLVRIERFGMKIDTEYLQSLKEDVERNVAKALDGLPKGFNVRSSTDMQKLMTSHGHTDWPVTMKGAPSFTEKWLKTHEIGRTVIDARKWSNLNNSFIEPLVGSHVFNGRVHPTINQNKADNFGTISGRLSCSNPNLQQIPKHNKALAKPFRRVFVADEGHEFYEADWSQAEPRLFAHYAKEPRLVEGYSATPFRDVHTIVAEMMNVDRGTTGKRMNMGMFTGMFPKTFSEHMSLPLDKATELWNQWQSLFPGIAGFQRQARSVIERRGYVRTILGRHGRMESRKLAYKAVSKIIQGSQADMMKYKMVELDKQLQDEGDSINILMQIHDSLVWQAPATEEGRARSIRIKDDMADVQTPPFNLIVPFVSDVGFGSNWSEASFGE